MNLMIESYSFGLKSIKLKMKYQMTAALHTPNHTIRTKIKGDPKFKIFFKKITFLWFLLILSGKSECKQK